MPRHRLLAYAFALWIAASSYVLHFVYVSMNGFPDGSTTELSRAEETLFTWVSAGSALLCIAFVYLGSRAGKAKNVNVLVAAYLLSAAVVIAIDMYLGVHLMDGQGG